jgi:hypothetical protein
VQAFRLGDGNLRYYARAEWKPKKDLDRSSYALGAWLAATPTLHILALEKRTCGYEDFACVLPRLLNVINLTGKVGIIIATHRDESIDLSLLEYQDGLDRTHMHIFQSIGMGE